MKRKLSVFLALGLLFSSNLSANESKILNVDKPKSNKEKNIENKKINNTSDFLSKHKGKILLSGLTFGSVFLARKMYKCLTESPDDEKEDPNKDKPNGGTPNGGTPNGGNPNGGIPNGGNPNGGIPNGGTPNGDMPNGGTPNGGTPNGGNPNGGTPDVTPQDINKIKLENLIPGVTDFLKDDNSINSYINSVLPEVTKILQKQNAVADLNVAPGGKVMVIGDVHGDEKTLIWVIKNSYEFLKKDENNKIVFLGDLVDQRFRGPDKSIHAILWALNLIKLFQDQVIVLHGNHEDIKGGDLGSINKYQNDNLNNCISSLPMACEIQSNGRKFFCSHGYIPALNNYAGFKTQVQKRNLRGVAIVDTSIEYGLMWNDPLGPSNINKGKKHGDTANQLCGSKYVGEEYSKKFFDATGYTAIFRGHDPAEEDIDIIVGEKYHVFTIHSLSWFISTIGNCEVEQGSQRNARIAIISDNKVEINYFLEDEKAENLTIEI